MQSAMWSKCSYDRGLFDGSIGGFLFEKLSEFVVGRGAEVDAVNPDGIEYVTALIAAAFFAHEDVVRILIKHSANVNKIVDKELFCALTAALEPYPYYTTQRQSQGGC
ncbi:hypothetical protein BDFG_07263 [Blastomyces dermatitidis ATCC 26199]|nr:hypothetical protein BDFG_07263 [Blastomyces dermatitidis ATCC 26199]